MNGVLCIHGFTGSPKELAPLESFIKNHTDWMIKTPVLPGHGEKLELGNISYLDWIRRAEEELLVLKAQCENIYVCGFSMGGIIASWLSAHYPVEKLVLLSAAAYYTNPKIFIKEIIGMFASTHKQPLSHNEFYQNFKRKFASTPIRAYMEFRKLVHSVRPILTNVFTPTLIVQGKMDPLVPEKSAHYLYENIQSQEKKMVFIENAKHQICYCKEQDELFYEILNFLDESSDGKKIALTFK